MVDALITVFVISMLAFMTDAALRNHERSVNAASAAGAAMEEEAAWHLSVCEICGVKEVQEEEEASLPEP